ncbi:hypothetical protein LEN26_019822 [Aphanomyces euteiches]|nr:hypothetical protein LEN26_019822 [Aphanomyces euteiches]
MPRTDFDDIMDFVAKTRPPALTLGERLDILRLQAYFRREKLPNPSAHIATILGRGIKTVQSVWSDYCNQNDVVVALPPANRNTHATRIPHTKQVMEDVLEFVRMRRLNQERVVAKDVLSMLVAKKHIRYDNENEKQSAAALRATQAYLSKHGFKRGSQRGGYGLSHDVIVKRDMYVSFIARSIFKLPKSTIVYIDESYIHHHYTRANDSVYHPHDVGPFPRKPRHKGRRLCFIAGIVEDGPDHSCLVGLEIFEGGRNQPKDYHAMFTHDYFVAWFESVLDELDALNKANVVFALDNAKYHRGKPAGTPTGAMKKSSMLEACEAYGLPVDPTSSKVVIWEKLKNYLDLNVKPQIETMAAERGHLVAWTPPYHSDLQPIELVWSYIKGKVGRQYTADTKFEDVRRRLDEAFENLSSSTIFNCITHTEKKIADISKHINDLDLADHSVSDGDEAYQSDMSSDNDFDIS